MGTGSCLTGLGAGARPLSLFRCEGQASALWDRLRVFVWLLRAGLSDPRWTAGLGQHPLYSPAGLRPCACDGSSLGAPHPLSHPPPPPGLGASGSGSSGAECRARRPARGGAPGCTWDLQGTGHTCPHSVLWLLRCRGHGGLNSWGLASARCTIAVASVCTGPSGRKWGREPRVSAGAVGLPAHLSEGRYPREPLLRAPFPLGWAPSRASALCRSHAPSAPGGSVRWRRSGKCLSRFVKHLTWEQHESGGRAVWPSCQGVRVWNHLSSRVI